MVYHYTTIEALYSILAKYNNSEDKDHFIFWASYILDQNDTEEMSLNIDDIRCILEDYEKEKHIFTRSIMHSHAHDSMQQRDSH